ncbi:hypothetical protein [Exiguobacterium qingdaonense]|uniref:hypothetical protein n=1 Tax=Exiguobacterium qingdaonense TaxID=2751251 RepID=UPI001BE955D3|nr:hypothetical protein [Exiguobacterium qingdaonense]
MIHDQLLEKHISPFMDLISVKLRTKKTHLLSLMSHNLLQRARYLEKKFTFTHNHQALLQGFTQSPPTYIEFDFQTVQVDDQEILIRKHCCLKYLEQDGDLKNSCKTCPKRYKDL